MERRTEVAVTFAWGSCSLAARCSPATGREKAKHGSGLCWLWADSALGIKVVGRSSSELREARRQLSRRFS